MSKTPRTIAVWLQLDPHQPLVGEGIGLHLSKLLEEWTKQPHLTIVVHAPRWAKEVTEHYLAAIVHDNGRIATVWHGSRIAAAAALKRRPPFVAPLRAPDLKRLPLPGPVAEKIVEAPPAAVEVPVRQPSKNPIKILLRPIVRAAFRQKARIIDWLRNYRSYVYQQMAASVSRSGADACYVAIGVWAGAADVEKVPLIVHLPDVVFFEFPEFFAGNPHVEQAVTNISSLAAKAAALVCVSRHVAENHLISGLGLPPAKVHVVGHAPVEHLPPPYGPDEQKSRRQALRAAVGRIVPLPDDRLVRLVYLPTQYRPYKNISRLLEAISQIHSHHIVLLTTAHLDQVPEIVAEVDRLGLHNQVLTVGRLSKEAHRDMFASVDLAITPSRFEGGFPFTFSEAVARGTPVVMADIAVTREILPEPLRARMSFDPLNVDEMTACLARALDDDTLLSAQTALFAQMEERRWADVANDYLSVIEVHLK